MQTFICQPAASHSLFTAEGFVGLIFLVTVGVTIFGAVIATTSKRLIRYVAGLAVAFTGVAGIYYFLLSPFVAMMQMLIYVGAVSILIAFSIMMAGPESHTGRYRPGILATPLGVSVGAVFFAALSILALSTDWQVYPEENPGSIAEIGKAFLTTHTMVFETISIVLLIAIIGALVLARKGRN
jgi:NADH:ubiquinone oxidoreductase subunit 6 (subunit J)